ncbi:MAG: hypothetical protein H6581_14710 [Bacteroidia bacterium]|nr:hypothetical protein [Bacteroidia bacterium]
MQKGEKVADEFFLTYWEEVLARGKTGPELEGQFKNFFKDGEVLVDMIRREVLAWKFIYEWTSGLKDFQNMKIWYRIHW